MNPLLDPTINRWLQPYQRVTTVRAALIYLTATRDRLQILHLYQQTFPTAWATGTSALDPTPGGLWSPREWEFFQHLHAERFPLDLELLAGADERPSAIPILDLTSAWRHGPLAADRPGWQFLWVLADAAPLTGITVTDPLVRQRLQQTTQGSFPPADRLWAACRAAGEPLAALPDALDLIYGETENSWLDGGLECEAGWYPEDLTTLTHEYVAAQALLAAVERLIDWLEHAPSRLLEVLDLWQTLQATRP